MKAFITGISGFAGKYLAEYLAEKGLEVYGIDRTGAKIEGADVEVCDILDQKKLARTIAAVKPDYVFHLAAQSSVPKSFEQPEETMRINVEGTRNLLEAILSAKISPTILVISSLQIYGKPDKVPITEAAELRPKSPYAKSKVEQERLCKEYGKKGLKLIISRSFNHTGPGQTPDFVWASFGKQIAEIEKGEKGELKVGNLEVERDFSDVRDIVKAYYLAVKKGKVGETYNICSGKAYNLRKMLDVLISNSKAKLKLSTDPKLVREDVPVLYGDNTKFCKATGWKPEIPFEKTLKDILEYWRKSA